jgi:hypothetical protein
MTKVLNRYERKKIEDMEKLLKERLSETQIDYRRLNINDYHYKDLQLPQDSLLELLVKYYTFWKRIGRDIQLKKYLMYRKV